MKKSVKRPWQRILAMVLCMAMVLSYVPATAQAVELHASDSVFTILAASDFQEQGDTNAQANANGAANVKDIAEEVTADHSVDAFFFCGDYSLTNEDVNATQEAYNALTGALNSAGLNTAEKVFVQGNHDPAGAAFLTATGGYEQPEYAYYVLNEDDWSFGGGEKSAVQTLANNLDTWLSGLTVGQKPVFILSHVPLHYSLRARNARDALYAEYLVDVLNEHGQRGLNIIFLFGHNHSGGYDAYIGGSTNYVGKGDTLWVSDPDSNWLPPVGKTINFTYLNAGYVGIYAATPDVDSAKTMSVFEIAGDDVTISRYDADGVHGVKPYAGNWTGSDANEPTYGHELNEAVFGVGDTVIAEGNDFAVTIPEAVAVNGLREGFSATVSAPAGGSYTWVSDNPGVATVTGGSNGSATIHAVEPGVAKITVAASGTSAASEGGYETMAEPQAEQTGSASFYLTVAEGAVEVQTESKFYRLAVQMKEGGKYMLVCGKGEGDAYALLASDAEGVRTIGKKDVRISVYNGAIPYVMVPSGTEDTAIWTFNSVNQETGEGFLNNNGRNDAYNRLAFAVPTGDWSSPEVMDIQTNPGSYGWKYSFDEGLHCTTGGRTWFLTRLYDERTPSKVINEWAVVRNDRHDTNFYFDVYAYEETPLTYTLTLSDMRGEVAENSTDTGTMIVKTWATGKVEYIDLTTAHLSVGSGTAGTYNNVTVTYGGVEICGDYTLVVGNAGNTITVPEGYYYRLTDTITPGKYYLFLNSNAKGDAKLMESTGDGQPVKATDVAVSLDANGIPSVLSRYITQVMNQNTNPTKISLQEWEYRTNTDATRQNMYQPNAFTSGWSNYLLVSGYNSGAPITGTRDGDSRPIRLSHFTYLTADTSDLIGYRTVAFKTNQKASDGSNKDQVQMYLTYHDGNFYATRDYDRRFGTETYAYERVRYTTAEVSALGTIGGVDSGSAADAKTGTYVQITYPDGHVENIPVTVNMLSKNGVALTAADIADKSASYELTGLTLKYEGVTLTTNYTLKVRDADTDPVHPEPGSVEVDKQKDTSEYNYEETGVARVDLTVSGVPMSKPVDVLLIVDTSASVEMYRMENGQTRIQAMRDATEALIDELAQPNTDGSLPDISLAISEFNNYTYFGEPNTFVGNDDTGKPYEPFGYTNYK